MRNATRDLKELVEKGIFEKRGIHGKGVHYVLGKSARNAMIQIFKNKTGTNCQLVKGPY